MTEPADSSQAANCDHIPIIDLSSLDSPQLEERQKLARAIYDACTQVGFFYIQVYRLRSSSVDDHGSLVHVCLTRIMASRKT